MSFCKAKWLICISLLIMLFKPLIGSVVASSDVATRIKYDVSFSWDQPRWESKLVKSLCTFGDLWASGGTDPLFWTSATRWRLMIGFTLRSPFARVQSHQYPLNRSLGGAKGVYGHFGVEKSPLFLPGTRYW